MAREKTFQQQRIVNSARKIITEKGMEHLTVREIAWELNVTDGALYRHFRSKKEIVSLLIDDIEETLLETINAAAAKSKNPLQQLENIFMSHLSYAEQRKGVSFLVISKTMSVKDLFLKKKMFGVLNKYLKIIKTILKEGIAAGKFRKNMNTESASIVFLGMVQSMVTLWGLSGYHYTLSKNRLEDMFNLYKTGITAR